MGPPNWKDKKHVEEKEAYLQCQDSHKMSNTILERLADEASLLARTPHHIRFDRRITKARQGGPANLERLEEKQDGPNETCERAGESGPAKPENDTCNQKSPPTRARHP